LDSVVKPLGITVKKEAGKVDETSGERYVDNPHATKEFGKRGNSPRRLKMTPKREPKKFLNFQYFENEKYFENEISFMAWCLRRCW